MGKRRKATQNNDNGPNLFTRFESRRRSGLILRRFLAEEADKVLYRDKQQARAHEILKRWADLEAEGHLAKKETSLDADFLLEVFGEALGYKAATESPDDYQLQRNFTVPGGGTADGALGNFRPDREVSPLVVIELKGPSANLDRDKFNGRTPVQQCWDYLNALPDCPWGIVSNFVSVRLYHRDKTRLAFEEFRLQELRDLRKFRQFYCLFERGGLVRPRPGWSLRALELLNRTDNRQREVGDKLYEQYSEERLRLIDHLCQKEGKTLERAIHIAQKILDRIIFVAFCEDRELLPAKCIDKAYTTLPPFSKVTNPRWRNFLDLFRAIDTGHPDFGLSTGYDGGLFAHDPEVDDLQLDDEWTNFFRSVGSYDFRDEVNVEVLGHIFEKSVAEIEKLRVGGLFALGESETPVSRMRKSAERKRFGIYYTPPDFTSFIVRSTVGRVIEERLAEVQRRHGLEPKETESDERSSKLAEYWRDCLDALGAVKICDPACGSGAFLVQAYDVFEQWYIKTVDELIVHQGLSAEKLEPKIPDMILAENLYGVDVSPQAVEITQLALWIRSARRNKTLADLSRNIVWGNSLVVDGGVHPQAMSWEKKFEGVFSRPQEPGFDCVIGNPPWERLKLQEREFFAFSAPKIAGAVSAAQRRKMITALQRSNPDLYARYEQAKQLAEQTLAHVRSSGSFPLTAKGDINTYMLFAELARKIVSPRGRVGLLVPSGIVTDKTTAPFFAELMAGKSLISLHDFENKAPVFPDVHRSFKFSTLVMGGSEVKVPETDFVFFARRMSDLKHKDRHIPLSSKDMALLNPNTRTCPIFRSRRDAQLTKAIYRRVPVLVDKSRKEGGNPWGIKFATMFHQTNDAELFRTREDLRKMKARQHGNRWKKGKQTFLPLYEAKMVQAFDHRAASVVVESANWMRQGQTDTTSPVAHQNPEFVVQPRWWVEESEVAKVLGERLKATYLCYKDVTSATNQRTMIAGMIPHAAVVNSAPLVLTGEEIGPRQECCLLGNLNSYALDFVARQKVGGVHLNFFIVEQLPLLSPDRHGDRCPWDKRYTLERWISDRVLKLTCTADDMRPLAEAAGFDPPVHKWNPAERAEVMAELDAAFFLLYGIRREDVEYILSTFSVAKRGEDATGRLFPVETSILEIYDHFVQR
ncbi:MAG: Eco57I restriction-modification methylase domain-containing protein [Planctomycetota bacterium]|jgi:hypothetical protein